MSGHSHFKTIKATKDANDAKRGKIFSKMGRVITIAAREKGGDIATNATLKAAIDRAREYNMPKENIERAIKKGTGELAGEVLEEVSIEGFGPGGISLIIEGITDNKNRTVGEIKGILGQFDGKMAGEGAVRWMFERKGFLEIDSAGKNSGEIEMAAIEAGADDVDIREGRVSIYTKPEDLEAVKKSLQEKQLTITSAALEWVPKEEVVLGDKDKEKVEKLFEALDDNDSVQDVFSNLKS